MPEELRLAGSFLLSLIAVGLLVPAAIRLAARTGFMDIPAGYKGHMHATPYLGGLAVAGAVAASVLTFGVATSRYGALVIWALVLFIVGTVDDKRNLSPYPRLLIEIGAAAALWHYGLGFWLFDSDALNLAITVVWVVGVVNAFNLMDNMDGAASSVAVVSALGISVLAITAGDVTLAVIVLAVAGACLGFLRFNLAAPPRIFLGDGGSMPLGFVLAAAVMALPTTEELGLAKLVALAPIVGLPILDTALVVVSRRRGGRPLLSGGRDHLTHRLRALLGSPRLVAVALATSQAALCLTAFALAHATVVWVISVGSCYVAAAFMVIYTLESRFAVATVATALGPIGVVPAPAAAGASSRVAAADELAA